jgi:pimeloyl-ACP methyl ester carboxylesterase
LVNHLHEANINLISFDFLRTQNGEINTHGIISFGMYEPKQVATIIDWAMKTFETKVIIWGRSMGAFVALRYQIEFGKASGLILDSSYISLQELIVKKFC